MRQIFADTFYWVALASPKDQWHEQAKQLSAALRAARLVTTEEVLSEFLTWFAHSGAEGRAHAVAGVKKILQDPDTRVVPQSHESFLGALELYEKRLDKQSMTGCISIQAMRSPGITEVLTHDEHFVQEGFQILLNKAS